MARSARDVLRDQGRGIAGALFVAGLPLLYTMETWWLGWRLPMYSLVVYAFVGLAAVLAITRRIGFQEDADGRTRRPIRRVVADFTELVLQSFVTAYVVLLVFGVLEVGESLATVVRLGLIHVVPLGFGAAVANRLLAATDEAVEPRSFARSLSTYTLGAVFVSFPVAPTQEIELIALTAGWGRLAVLVVLSVAIAYLVLYELEFRGHQTRIEDRTTRAQVGSAFVVYLVGVAVSVVLLAAFGHYDGTTPGEWVQQTIVLAFLASAGASAGEVVL